MKLVRSHHVSKNKHSKLNDSACLALHSRTSSTFTHGRGNSPIHHGIREPHNDLETGNYLYISLKNGNTDRLVEADGAHPNMLYDREQKWNIVDEYSVSSRFNDEKHWKYPGSKVHGANMGPTWVLSAPDGPHVDPMNLAMWVGLSHWHPCLMQTTC